MNDTRNQSLGALTRYIEAQRRLLQQNEDDIRSLETLKSQIGTMSDNEMLDDLSQLNLKDYFDHDLPSGVDWSTVNILDERPFRALAKSCERVNSPASFQATAPTFFQTLVKDKKSSILGGINLGSPLFPRGDDESDEEMPPAKLTATRSNAKPRRNAGLTITRIHRPIDVDSIDVDIMDVDQPMSEPTQEITEAPLPETPPSAVDAVPMRKPKPTQKNRLKHNGHTTGTTRGEATASNSKAKPSATRIQDAQTKQRQRKSTSETYNQPWTEEEQRLLERLLTEIPVGEAMRWSKISKAMNGKRTPRQVASRVQKYFAKLEQFGVDVGSGL